ncbi:MAG: CRISPR system precrRNA processing endoribonuclease RAMP protein Cas6, partial [Syntrophales bacterium]|nr:CRISPR system precrRNA processing endoribonuclease RAMP protein Cas6 [Syntrophales bacterium]
MKDPPRGFVIKPSLDKSDIFTQAHPFSFDIVLFGNRILYHPWIIVPINALGSVGLGPKRDRFVLFDIEAIKNGKRISIYDSATKTVRNETLNFTLNDLYGEIEKLSKDKIMLEFLTPTRIRYNPTGEKGKSQVVHVPEFHQLFKRLRDRISALVTVYGEESLNIDFKGLGERAERVTIRNANIRWIEIKRRSRTQHTWHDQSGFVGKVIYTGELAELFPFLVIGQYIHV